MTLTISSKEFLRAKQLEALGIPLDGEVLEKSQEACHRLWIGQDPNNFETILFDLGSRGTSVMITLKIWNESDQMIRLAAARLEIPWCDQIHWLEDPHRDVPRKLFYSFPSPVLQRYERDAVLNHRFGPNGKLLSGFGLHGFLLGIGEEPIPDHYRDRELYEARLSIFDGRNNPYSLDLKFLVMRDLKHRQGLKAAKQMVAASPATRRSLSWMREWPETSIRLHADSARACAADARTSHR
jgi:hypothetical protein